MDQASINILIGGGIAIISALVGGIVTFVIQFIDAEKKRKWYLADRKLDQRRTILSKRLDDVEQTISLHLKWIFEFNQHLATEDWKLYVLSDALKSMTKADDIVYNSMLVNNKELISVAEEFNNYSAQFYINIGENKNNHQELTKGSIDYQKKVKVTALKILTIIDTLRQDIP